MFHAITHEVSHRCLFKEWLRGMDVVELPEAEKYY